MRKQVVRMPLGQGIGEMWAAVRDRVEVAGHGPTWHVTAGSFDSALAYARDRFEDPAVLSRTDRRLWWPRVTLTVTTDPALAAAAPPLADVAQPAVLPHPGEAAQTAQVDRFDADSGWDAGLPASLEAIFAHQEERRTAGAPPSRHA